MTVCRLDIDIKKNQPRVMLHERVENTAAFRGTEISLVVGGSWSTYRAYVVRYLRQMAVPILPFTLCGPLSTACSHALCSPSAPRRAHR